MSNYKKEAAVELANAIKTNTGYRVFLSERRGCAHGFITNETGSRVVSFQYDIFGFRFSGNYKSKSCGTGWRMDGVEVEHVTNKESLDRIFDNNSAPLWATKGEQVRLVSLDDHLKRYGASSMFVEVV